MTSIVMSWLLLDWVFYGSRAAHALVYRHMSPGVWSQPRSSESDESAQRRTMVGGVVLTVLSAILFTIFGEWMGFAGLQPISATLTGVLLWACCTVPLVLQERLYLAVGSRFTFLQLFAWAVKIAVAMALFLLRM